MSYNYDELVHTITTNRRAYYDGINNNKNNDGDNDDDDDGQGKGEGQPQPSQPPSQPQPSQPPLVHYLQTAVETFEILSTSCPMTPLLWMQYAYDTSNLLQLLAEQGSGSSSSSSTAPGEGSTPNDDNDENNDLELKLERNARKVAGLETRISMLEIALNEFPGSAVLHVHYLELLKRLLKLQQNNHNNNNNNHNNNQDDDVYDESFFDNVQRYQTAITTALTNVGQGSHRNESSFVAKIYQLQADFMIVSNQLSNNIHNQTNHNNNNNNNGSSSSSLPSSSDDELSNAISELFVRRSKVPMGNDMNSGLSHQYELFCEQHNIATCKKTLQRIDNGRRYESKVFSSFQTYEDNITAAMEEEGIIFPNNNHTNNNNDDASSSSSSDELLLQQWDDILQSSSSSLSSSSINNWGMGYGGHITSQAFINYAQACARYRSPSIATTTNDDEDDPMDVDVDGNDNNDNDNDDNDNDDTAVVAERHVRSLTDAIYERGIAECPTVETLWLSYIDHLFHQINPNVLHQRQETTTQQQQQQQQQRQRQSQSNLLYNLKSVVDRAVRNCPYSTSLYQHKIRIMLLQANYQQIVFDPDDILKILKEDVVGGGFITSPESITNLSLTVIDVVRKRILSILATEAGVMKNVVVVDANKTKGKGKKKQQQHGVKSVVFVDYDGVEDFKVPFTTSLTAEIHNSSSSPSPDEDAVQEIEDLITDLQDLYDEIETLLRKKFVKYAEGRAKIWKDRAMTQSLLLGPLMESFNNAEDDNDVDDRHIHSVPSAAENKQLADVVRYFDKAIKVHLPSSPTTIVSYIQGFLASFPVLSSSPIGVLKKLRLTRSLYQKGMATVGRAKHEKTNNSKESSLSQEETNDELDYDIALRYLCHEYTEFERLFGSEQSYLAASKEVKRKIAKAEKYDDGFNLVATTKSHNKNEVTGSKYEGEESTPKRALDGGNDVRLDEEPPLKKAKVSAPNGDLSTEQLSDKEPNATSTEQDTMTSKTTTKKNRPKVKVGKLEYPAHPYTVRVSFLAQETDDMDLVDLLRPICGAIVHAKIMREKASSHYDSNHNKPKSKGWALVQFEEQESVEKALALSGEIGLHEKVIQIERSHVAAVGVVPAGMHRVNPKGHGKNTKKNLKRKEHVQQHHTQDSSNAGDTATNNKGSNTSGINDEKQSSSDNSKQAEANKREQQQKSTSKSSNQNVLLFRPRGVSTKAKKPKSEVVVDSKK